MRASRNHELFAQLKEFFLFTDWQGINSLDTHCFIFHYQPQGEELPGWRMHNCERLEDMRPPLITSIWLPIDHTADSMLVVDIRECDSRNQAHENLLKYLGEFQTPMARRLHSSSVGDIAFGHDEDSFILFARANLVVSISNGESEKTSVTKAAKQLDNSFIGPANSGERQISMQLESSSTQPLDIDDNRIATYRFFSSTGEIHLDNGKPTYQATSKEQPRINVFIRDR